MVAHQAPSRIPEHDESRSFGLSNSADIEFSYPWLAEHQNRPPLRFEATRRSRSCPIHARSLPSLDDRPTRVLSRSASRWSKRTRIRGSSGTGRKRRRSVEAARRKFQNSLNPVARYVKLLNDFVDVRTRFQVFEDRCHRHARALENPSAASPVRHTLNGRTLGSIQGRH